MLSEKAVPYFSFKSKTPSGKGFIKKAFFKGLWKRQHEKKGEKKEFKLQEGIVLHCDTPLGAP